MDNSLCQDCVSSFLGKSRERKEHARPWSSDSFSGALKRHALVFVCLFWLSVLGAILLVHSFDFARIAYYAEILFFLLCSIRFLYLSNFDSDADNRMEIGAGGGPSADLGVSMANSPHSAMWFSFSIVSLLFCLLIFGSKIEFAITDWPKIFGRFKTSSVEDQLKSMLKNAR